MDKKSASENFQHVVKTMLTEADYKKYLVMYTQRKMELLPSTKSFSLSDFLREIIDEHLQSRLAYSPEAELAKVSTD